MAYRYAAFISYRHRLPDNIVAFALHRHIEGYNVPKSFRRNGKRHIGRVFRDKEVMRAGGDLNGKLREYLDDSEYLIMVCTPATPESEWCNEELDYFLRHHSRENVLVVLLDGTSDTSIPRQLLTDGDRRTVPLCADLVSRSPWLPVKIATALLRLGDEFLRLAANMLQCDYEVLKQRKKRRNRRILAVASVTALTIIGLLTAQNIKIQEQNREISAQKVQLEQQLEQTLRNESETLALVSAQQLKNGDRRLALDSAVRALPHDGNQRPYMASAEYALANALYAYQEDCVRFDTCVQQNTDVIDMTASRDGSKLVTLDLDGTVRCFDMDNQCRLWEYQLRMWNMDPVAASIYVNDLHILEQRGSVVCVDQWSVTILSLEDGSVQKKWDNMGAYYGEMTAVTPDETGLILAGPDWLVLFDLQTGDVEKFTYFELYAMGGTLYQPKGISFSDDGSTAACLFCAGWKTSEPDEAMVVFIDLENLKDSYARELAYSEGACIASLPNGKFLYTTAVGDQYLLVELTDEGDVHYENTVRAKLSASTYHSYHPGDVTQKINSGRVAAVGINETVACWVYDNAIIAVDLGDYSLICSVGLNNRCIWADLSEDSRLTYALTDGSIYSIQLNGDIKSQLRMDCGFSLAMGAGEGEHFMVLPENTPSRCLRLAQERRQWGDTLAETVDGGVKRVYRDSAESILFVNTEADPDGWNSPGMGYMVDLQTLKEINAFSTTYTDFVTLTSQGEKVLTTTVAFNADNGEAVDLDEGVSGIDFVRSHTSVSLSDQRPGKPVLSVALSGDKYCWWLDGQNPRVVEDPCPDMVLRYPDPYWSDVEVGGNGLFAAQYSNSPDAEYPYIPCPTTVFAIYDTETEAWTLLDNPTESPTISARTGLSLYNKWMVIIDEYGTMFLYDNDSQKMLLTADVGISATAVDQLNFVQQDKILLITQINGTVTAIDTDTGKEVAAWQIRGYDREQEFVICEDGSRLYFCETGGGFTGKCIDMNTWTVIADIPGLACCLPKSGKIIRVDPESGRVAIGSVYTCGELIEWAKSVS